MSAKIKHSFNSFRLITFILICIGPGLLLAQESSFKQKLNAAAGREVFVDEGKLPEKIYAWSDLKKWIMPRGNDALRMAYPENLKGSGISEEISVFVIITPDGTPVNPQIENLKNKQLAIPAIMHVAQLKFERPKLNGKPIYYRQKVKLVCSEDPKFGKK